VRENGTWLFLLGLALFGTAAAVDVLLPHEGPFVREEASTFLAIVTWMLFTFGRRPAHWPQEPVTQAAAAPSRAAY
jgi:hypothetical protein